MLLARRDTHQLASRITVLQDDSLLLGDGRQLAILDVVTDEGVTRITRLFLKGNLKDPLTRDEVMAKFRSCAAIAAPPLGETQMERAAEMLNHIELVPDVGDLVRALC